MAEPTHNRRIRPRRTAGVSEGLPKTSVLGRIPQVAIAAEVLGPSLESLQAGVAADLDAPDLFRQQAGTFFLQLGSLLGIPGAAELSSLEPNQNGRIQLGDHTTALEDVDGQLVPRFSRESEQPSPGNRGHTWVTDGGEPDPQQTAGRDLQAHLTTHPRRDELRAQYPEVAERIEALAAWARRSVTNQDSPLSEYTLTGLTPEHRALLHEIYARMQDGESAASYLSRLMEDALEFTEGRNREKEMAALGRGHITRNNMLRVLVQRSQARGEKLTTLRDRGSEGFREGVRNGPFFDNAFGLDSTHGPDVHLIQWDYISDLIYGSGDVTGFNEALAEDTHRRRLPLFDAVGGTTASNPDNLMDGVRKTVIGYDTFRRSPNVRTNRDLASLTQHALAPLHEVSEEQVAEWLAEDPATVTMRWERLSEYHAEFGLPKQLPTQAGAEREIGFDPYLY